MSYLLCARLNFLPLSFHTWLMVAHSAPLLPPASALLPYNGPCSVSSIPLHCLPHLCVCFLSLACAVLPQETTPLLCSLLNLKWSEADSTLLHSRL